MPVKSKLKNLAIIIDSIGELQKINLTEIISREGIEQLDFIETKKENFSARKNLLEKFKNLLLNSSAAEITCEEISKLEPEYDLIIKVGKNSQNLQDSIIIGASYAEIYFADIDAENFDLSELQKALEDFETRQRNFGV